MTSHTPLHHHIYVNVDNRFLGPQMPKGTTRGIWHGICSRPYQTLLCHVFLESGAHWSGLPLHALSATDDFSIDRRALMPWTAMGDTISCTAFPYLEGLRATDRSGRKGRHTGMVIDWSDGYSRYPAEHKPLQLIAWDSGQWGLLPNNYIRLEDDHFVSKEAAALLPLYRRGEEEYWE